MTANTAFTSKVNDLNTLGKNLSASNIKSINDKGLLSLNNFAPNYSSAPYYPAPYISSFNQSYGPQQVHTLKHSDSERIVQNQPPLRTNNLISDFSSGNYYAPKKEVSNNTVTTFSSNNQPSSNNQLNALDNCCYFETQKKSLEPNDSQTLNQSHSFVNHSTLLPNYGKSQLNNTFEDKQLVG